VYMYIIRLFEPIVNRFANYFMLYFSHKKALTARAKLSTF
jgi:hypothetical protein